MAVKPKSALTVDEFELYCLSRLTSPTAKASVLSQFEELVTRISLEISQADVSSCAAFRAHMTPWWRVIGTCAETALTVTTVGEASVFCAYITTCMAHLKVSIDGVVSNWDSNHKETISVYTGFNLAYTSIVRCILESVFAFMDPLLACDALLGLESLVPMDNKGICNVYKKTRSVETEDVHIRDSMVDVSFPEASVFLEDGKSFEKFWTVMNTSRRLHTELLCETKAWGKFSQSSSASLAILMEQSGEDLQTSGSCAKEPIQYECKLSSFPIQLTSSSFRRRAVFNILFTTAYVVQNATNALITAGAKTLFQSVLKSLPGELHAMTESLLKFENHWLAWKSSVHSKEVCGPFEHKSRIERGLVPFGDEPAFPERVIATVTSDDSLLTDLLGSADKSPQPYYACDVTQRLEEYRQYVADAILCDVSDDTERERLGANDEGLEEAMRNNNDSVLLWQFKRMRFDQTMSMALE